MKLSENFRKADEISLEAQFCENETENITTEKLKTFWKIFVEFSVNYQQTAGDFYLNKYPTILVSHFLKVLSFKTR